MGGTAPLGDFLAFAIGFYGIKKGFCFSHLDARMERARQEGRAEAVASFTEAVVEKARAEAIASFTNHASAAKEALDVHIMMTQEMCYLVWRGRMGFDVNDWATGCANRGMTALSLATSHTLLVETP